MSMKSGYKIRRVTFEAMQDEYHASAFVRRLCVAIWGHRELSRRCVKKDRNTEEGIIPLEPNMLRIVKEHTRYFLYRTMATTKEYYDVMGKKFNKYLHTAIIQSKKVMRNLDGDFQNEDFDNELTDSGDEL